MATAMLMVEGYYPAKIDEVLLDQEEETQPAFQIN
jgi:hypothetical protein